MLKGAPNVGPASLFHRQQRHAFFAKGAHSLHQLPWRQRHLHTELRSSSSSEQPDSSQEGQPTRSGEGQAKQGPKQQKGKLQSLYPTDAAKSLLIDAGQLLRRYFWPILITYAAKDAASFLLHRVSQRLTNSAAAGIFGTSIPAAANPWWLYLESSFLENSVGYQACIVGFFLLALPLNILLSSLAASSTALVCAPELVREKGGAALEPGISSSSSSSGSSSDGGSSGSGSSSDEGRHSSSSNSSSSSSRSDVDQHGSSSSGQVQSGQGGQGEAEASDSGVQGHTSAASSSQPVGTSSESMTQDNQGAGTRSHKQGQQQAEASTTGAGSAGSSQNKAQSEGEGVAGREASSSTSSSSDGGAAQQEGAATTSGLKFSEGGQRQEQSRQEQQQSKPGIMGSLKAGAREVRAVFPHAVAMAKRVWLVDVLFNLRALPLQGLSMLVLPVFWTVPRLLAIQLAVPASIVEGKKGSEALSRSAQLMDGFKSSYGWPFVALILAARFVDGVRNTALAALPPRWWQDVIEVPILLTALFSFAKLLLIRLQDLIPLAAYLYALKRDSAKQEDGQGGESRYPVPGTTQS